MPTGKNMYCKNCKTEKEVIEKNVTFANGTKHIEARCVTCAGFIKYMPYKTAAETVMHFGKYKGKTLVEIKKEDEDYLGWVMDQPWCKANLRNKIESLWE